MFLRTAAELRLHSHFLVSSFACGPMGRPRLSWKEGVMLSVCVKGDYLTATPLSAAEDAAIRKAFGRFAAAEARSTGPEIVQRYQHQGDGNWFLCGCLNGLEARPPVLIPVLESYHPAPHRCALCRFRRNPPGHSDLMPPTIPT
jgi:hypothetical protein